MLMGAPPQYRRYRAPREDNTALVEPPLAEVRIAPPCPGIHFDLGELSLGELRKTARQELLTAARQYVSTYCNLPELPGADAPLILTGHQAEIYHPGVWFKNFMLSRLAREHRGVGIHLVVDTDTLHSPGIRVPTGSPQAPRIEAVAMDRAQPRLPVEELRVDDAEMFASFVARVTQAIEPLVASPLVREWWPSVLEALHRTDNRPGLAIAQARHELEASWGATSLELPMSACCELPSFYQFAAAILRDAPRVRETYNAALTDYRAAHGLRSEAQPMPNLAQHQGWIEAPLWVWCVNEPARRPLFVKQLGSSIQLSNRAGWSTTISDSSHDAVAQGLADIAARGVKIRTRALTTTLFARLVLGDLFLHGIGGAKYDEVADDLARRLWGCPPPPYLTLSATLELPVAHQHVGAEQLSALRQQIRDCDWHPEQMLPADCSADATKAEATKQRWIEQTKTHENARERHRAIHDANTILRQAVASTKQHLESQFAELTQAARASAMLESREFSFCLYPEQDLRQRMWRLVETA
ncbi:hypothetical protein [Aeoliella sp. SH292]|uniref:hypothetical protein n=1 Tax=Aeoliella sp. SH292 TaxID=3454464 RepID=UPI003F9DF25C